MKKIICYLASITIVVGMTACRNSDSSSADTSSDNTEITASSTNTTTTTTITTTITTTSKPEPITKSEPDDMELVYEKVLFDNSVIKAYLYDDDCVLSQVYFSNDDPKTNIVNFSITASSVESEFANSDFKPSSISWWAFYEEDVVFTIMSNKQSDGTYSSPLGIVWYDNDYKIAYENGINNDDTVDENSFDEEYTLITQYEFDDGTEIELYSEGADKIMVHINFSEDKPKNNIITFANIIPKIEQGVPEGTQTISYWGLYDNSLLFSSIYEKQPDGTFSSAPLGVLWTDETYKKTYDELYENLS